MARIEKTVFISYRRSDVYTALAVYENLKNQGYDVFFDYRSISSGDFEQIITSNIRARAHFLLILTATALDRCDEPGDWLRREIELAIDEKRNIIPLFFKGFRFGNPAVSEKLTGKLKDLSRYNGLNVHEDYFDEAMHRLRTQYLNIPLNTVLHPVSTEVQRVVRAEQVAADKALEQIENVQELVKHADEELLQHKGLPKPFDAQNIGRATSRIPWRRVLAFAGGLLVIALSMWSGSKIFQNLAIRPELTSTLPTNATLSFTQVATITSRPEQTNTPLIEAPSDLGIGSTKVSDTDGMTLLYVPAGEFTMGIDIGNDNDDERPAHMVDLDAFWIDRTEITNHMYSLCVSAEVCNEPTRAESQTRSSYYGNPQYNNYPVIYVNWDMAKGYCEWAGRRLPTEAEWEKAARGTDQRLYPWGNNQPTSSLLSFGDRVGSDTTEVGGYPNGVSPYGALDMAGNVWEWVADWYGFNYYDNSPTSNPLGPSEGERRVLRGGAWWYARANTVTTVSRYSQYVAQGDFYYGFRCAVSASEQMGSGTSQPSATEITPETNLGIGSTMTGSDGMTLVYVPAGEFEMGTEDGDADEKPVHQVYLDSFWIDKTEVTNKMYALCVADGVCASPSTNRSATHSPYYGVSRYENFPVVFVDWNEAKTYCEWAGRRLPSEAEWEKAARGTDRRVYPWGNAPPNNALLNFNTNIGDTSEVGRYAAGASPYGASDMAGNVWEWVADWYDPNYYSISPSANPVGPGAGEKRVLRGGAWVQIDISVRSSNRHWDYPIAGGNVHGFRCAMDATP